MPAKWATTGEEKISCLANLELLTHYGHSNLADATNMGKLLRLKSLNLSACKISDVANLGALTNLKHLTLLCDLVSRDVLVKVHNFTDLVQLFQDGQIGTKGVEHLSKLSNLHLTIKFGTCYQTTCTTGSVIS